MKPASDQTYVLITAAHNEGTFIGKTIESVVSQAVRPSKWIIVNDRSTDQTAEIVECQAKQYPFIEVLRVCQGNGRDFAAKVNAIKAGYARLENQPYDFIGILDGDVEFDPLYYSSLLDNFRNDSRLGLAGGFIYEESNGTYQSRRTNTVTSVAGAIQLFRRECYEAIGGLQALRYGGEDWCAEISARMKGWKVEASAELKVCHRRPTGTGGGLVSYWFRQGRMDFSIGSLPLFEVVKIARRLLAKPLVIGALARLAGFVISYLIGAPRLVSEDLMCYLRSEQRHRLYATLGFKTQQEVAVL